MNQHFLQVLVVTNELTPNYYTTGHWCRINNIVQYHILLIYIAITQYCLYLASMSRPTADTVV